MGSVPGSGRSSGGEIPVLLPGRSHGQRNPAGYSPWGCEESDTTWQLNNNHHQGYRSVCLAYNYRTLVGFPDDSV